MHGSIIDCIVHYCAFYDIFDKRIFSSNLCFLTDTEFAINRDFFSPDKIYGQTVQKSKFVKHVIFRYFAKMLKIKLFQNCQKNIFQEVAGNVK